MCFKKYICFRIWTIILLVISVIITIPTLIIGCAPWYSECIAYTPKTLTIQNTSITQHHVRYCVIYSTINKIKTCTLHRTRTYYSIDLNMKDCIYVVSTEYKEYEDANTNAINKYPSGMELELLQDKTDLSVCYEMDNKPKTIAIVGLVFSSLSLLFLLMFIISYLF